MDKFIHLGDKDKRVYFEVATADLNVVPQLIEKDFWVCWILKILFSLPESGGHLTFKGGTSLSKCYDVIRRFSEDVDVSIERTFLSSEASIEPNKDESNKENQRRLERLQVACREKISNTLIPELEKSIREVLTDKKSWGLKLDPKDALGQMVLFAFSHSLTSGVESYIKSAVKIEFGSRADHWPVEKMIVTPYVANVSGNVGIEGAPVRVLAAERTFWEKATILHMVHNYPEGKNVPPVREETKIFSEKLDFDPLWMISSGALVISLSENKTEEALQILRNSNITASSIGRVKEGEGKLLLYEGNKAKLYEKPVPEKDELAKLWRSYPSN